MKAAEANPYGKVAGRALGRVAESSGRTGIAPGS
jgi:hypothetical protein